ncbi:unnamed protein product [Closterium sp. NIES-53]
MSRHTPAPPVSSAAFGALPAAGGALPPLCRGFASAAAAGGGSGAPRAPATESEELGANRVVEASLTLVRERARLKAEKVRAAGGAEATACLLGVPLGHNSSFLQGPAFAPPRIREAIWCGSTNSATEEGKDLNDIRVLTDVGDVPVQVRVGYWCRWHLVQVASGAGEGGILVQVASGAGEGGILVQVASGAGEGGILVQVASGAVVGVLLPNLALEQYEMRHFHRNREMLENLELGQGVKGVYVSIDIDCLDPAFAPGVSHIEPGGLSFRDVMNILQNLKGNVVAGDVVELNPQRDTVDGMTAMVAAKFVRELAARISK